MNNTDDILKLKNELDLYLKTVQDPLMGNSQYFHALALYHVIAIFDSYESKTNDDYDRLHQQIAGFVQSATIERCFYEDKSFLNVKSLAAFQNPPTAKKEYSSSLSMQISNQLISLRAGHLANRNLWQKFKSLFVGGFSKAQEVVDLKKFTNECKGKLSDILCNPENGAAESNRTTWTPYVMGEDQRAEKRSAIEDFQKKYINPINKRIGLLPMIGGAGQTARDLTEVKQRSWMTIKEVQGHMGREENDERCRAKAISSQPNLTIDVTNHVVSNFSITANNPSTAASIPSTVLNSCGTADGELIPSKENDSDDKKPELKGPQFFEKLFAEENKNKKETSSQSKGLSGITPTIGFKIK